jgi:Transcriptional regulators
VDSGGGRRGSRASDAVADSIRAQFFAGLGPGDWLGTESELAARFGVSRITVRDAIRTLEAQGILTVVLGARGGLRVAEAATDRVSDTLAVQLQLAGVSREEVAEAMSAIEPTTARRAAQRCDDDDARRLRALLAQAEDASEDPEAFTAAALDFHLCLAEIARNRALIASVRALRVVEQRHFAPATTPAVVRRVLESHTAIAEAVIAHDADAATRAMAVHLDRVAMPDRAPLL